MKILILGGSQFVGRHIAGELLSAGHIVTTLTRGITADKLPDEVERLRGDREKGPLGLKSLKGHFWDACVDVSGYTALQVRSSAEMLSSVVNRYVFVSAVSVYGDPDLRPVRETHPLVLPVDEDVTEINSETYGRLKVTCENIVRQIYGNRCTLLRPQIVAGPYDPYDRFSYWVRRTLQEGEMLAPGDGSDHLQIIDACDVARFTVKVIENNIGGAFNLAGHRLTWKDFMKILGPKNIIWVPAGIIKSAGLTESELPLYRQEHGARSSLMDVSSELARKAGLNLTDIEVTIKNIQDWLPWSNLIPALSPEREAELIAFTRRTEEFN